MKENFEEHLPCLLRTKTSACIDLASAAILGPGAFPGPVSRKTRNVFALGKPEQSLQLYDY